MRLMLLLILALLWIDILLETSGELSMPADLAFLSFAVEAPMVKQEPLHLTTFGFECFAFL